MYQMYIVSDAAALEKRSDLFSGDQKKLLWDPKTESDVYAVINPKFKEEMNKAASLEFTILPSNIRYNDIRKRRSVIMLYDEGELLFEGAVSAVSVDFYKQKKVTCSGVLSYLCDSIQAPDEKNSVVMPTSSESGTLNYILVPNDWINGSVNPKSNNWYERTITKDDDGNVVSIEYAPTKDTTPAADKKYYYAEEAGDGDNHSGTTYTKKASTKESLKDHIVRLLGVHNAQMEKNAFKIIKPGRLLEDTTTHEFKSSNYRTTWDALESDILDDYGRYFTLELGVDNEWYLNYLDLLQTATTPNSTGSNVPKVEFTNNMIEMSEKDDSDDELFTVLIPLGKNNKTVADVYADHKDPESSDSTKKVDPYIAEYGGEKRYVVVSKYALQTYGFIAKTQTFSDKSSAEDVWTAAKEYIYNNFDFHTEYDVKGIDLHILDPNQKRIKVGDHCRIVSKWHKIDDDTQKGSLYVLSAEHDLINPENDTYSIGIPTSDKEATNTTLTSQSSSTSSSSSSSAASSAAATQSLQDQLDGLMEVKENWIYAHAKLQNTVTTTNGEFMTRFEQDEYHINLTAQKIFGYDDDKVQDAGFMKVPASEYPGKNPKTEHWYTYNETTGKYTLTDHTTPRNGVTYYMKKIVTRISEIDVGSGGIRARVLGNSATANMCASWIEMNEDAILALTGHIHVDENGQVIVDSGAGFRTGSTTTTNDGNSRYIKVPKSWYKVNNKPVSPKDKGWYERSYDSSGSDYTYVESQATKADENVDYYYVSNTTETFTAEFGVYDENNLTAGIIARTVNNPQYYPIPQDYKKAARQDGVNPSQATYVAPDGTRSAWYEYSVNDPTSDTYGRYGITLDTKVNVSKDYRYVKNNSSNDTYLVGDRIVIGAGLEYNGLDPNTEQRVQRYLDQNTTLTGTITHIASDITVVNALFAKFIDFESAHGISIDVDYLSASEVDITTKTEDGFLNADVIHGRSITSTYVGAEAVEIGSIQFGSFEGEAGNEAGVAPEDIVVGFGTITTSGDTVHIPYITAGDDPESPNAAHKLSFDKPASLGKAVWSSGGKLDIYTVGGWAATPKWKFYSASINIPDYYQGTDSNNNPVVSYGRNGYDIGGGILFNGKPTVKAHMEITGDDWDKHGNASAFPHDSSESSPIMDWTKDIYVDATLPYNDGWDKACKKMDWPPQMQANGERTSCIIGYPNVLHVDQQTSRTLTLLDEDSKGSSGFVRLYLDYVDLNSRGLQIGAIQVGDWYTKGKDDGILEAKGKFGLYGPATGVKSGDSLDQSEAAGFSNPSTVLAYGTNYMVYKTYDGQAYPAHGSKVFFKTPGVGATSTYYYRYNGTDWGGTDMTSSATISLNYQETIRVKGRHVDAFGTAYSGPLLYIVAPESRYKEGWDNAVATLGIDPANDPINLAYGSSTTVTASVTQYNGQAKKLTRTVTAPSLGTTYTYYYYYNDSGAQVTNSLSANATYNLDYGKSVYVYGHHIDGLSSGHSGHVLTITAPANNATTHSISIPNDGFDVSDTQPTGEKHKNLQDAIKNAVTNKKYFYFTVKCGNATSKVYYMDFR